MARKKLKDQKTNRVRPILTNLIGTESSDQIMEKLAVALNDTNTNVPIPGKVYVYSYIADKENLLTDLFPIVQVTGIYGWGWSGMNLHIKEPRNYSFGRNVTPLYMLKPSEVQTALTLPLMQLYQN